MLLRQAGATAAGTATTDAAAAAVDEDGGGDGEGATAAAAGKGNSSTSAAAASCKSAKGKGKQQYTPSIRGFFKPVQQQQQKVKGGKGSGESNQQQQQGEEGQEEEEQGLAVGQVSELTEVQWRAKGVKVYYLLTQRPEGGLLAGLWEFPSVVLGEGEEEENEDGGMEGGEGAAAEDNGKGPGKGLGGRVKKGGQEQKQKEQGSYSNAVCRGAVDQYMREDLGIVLPGARAGAARACGSKAANSRSSSAKLQVGALEEEGSTRGRTGAAGGVQLVDRCHMGSIVHIFSHIRQVNHVEQFVLVADSLQEVCPGAVMAVTPAEAAAAAVAAAAGSGSSSRGGVSGPKVMCWVQQEALKGFGLTAGVRKALALVQKGS